VYTIAEAITLVIVTAFNRLYRSCHFAFFEVSVGKVKEPYWTNYLCGSGEEIADVSIHVPKRMPKDVCPMVP